MSLLDRLDESQGLSSFTFSELATLSQEIRRLIVEVVGRNGGHLASNLGVVELTIALHRIFSSPEDAIVWDVGHQSYTHKILTGRLGRFRSLRRKDGLSGFPRRSESERDAFDTGHASTSISAALGILEAKRSLGRKGKAIAVIGDAALSGGMAQEALSHSGQLGRDLIIILNDNKMSISANVGAFSSYLSRLTATSAYQRFRDRVDRIILSIPWIGRRLHSGVVKMKSLAKAAFFRVNYFSELGFEYVGPIDGHNLPLLMHTLKMVKSIDRPTVVHVLTRKGKGHQLAEDNPAAYHGVSPIRVSDGKVEPKNAASFTDAFGEAIMRAGAKDARVVAVTAAMAKGTGLSPFQKAYPRRFYDVGIAEQHAVTFAAGMASAGLKPVVAIYSTFLQRAYDQVLHDVALQSLPVVFCLDRAGPVGEDGETHQGLYDISFLRPLPHLDLLAPASGIELGAMLDWALERGSPAAIRYPKCDLPKELPAYAQPIVRGRGVFMRRSLGPSGLLLVSMGGLVPAAEEALDELARRGIQADHYQLRFLKPIDEAYLLEVLSAYRSVLILEEGIRSGGAGESILALSRAKIGDIALELVAFPDRVFGQMTRDEYLECVGLSGPAIAKAAESLMRAGRRFGIVKENQA
jgi:1-deoxy-D-xylulose-5-phosphate synthase